MKIIKPATSSLTWKNELTCPTCSAILEVIESDLVRWIEDLVISAGPARVPRRGVICPECQTKIVVDVPQYVISRNHWL